MTKNYRIINRTLLKSVFSSSRSRLVWEVVILRMDGMPSLHTLTTVIVLSLHLSTFYQSLHLISNILTYVPNMPYLYSYGHSFKIIFYIMDSNDPFLDGYKWG